MTADTTQPAGALPEPSEGEDREAFYDAEIAPALKALADRCQEAGLPFLAMVEYRRGSVGLTIDHPDIHESGPQFRLASYGARCFGNADKLIAALLKDDERHAEGESMSFYLQRLKRLSESYAA